MSSLKRAYEIFLAGFIIVGAMISPVIVLVASVLSGIDYYLVGNSVLMGIVGFFSGGFISAIAVLIGLFIATMLFYFSRGSLEDLRGINGY